MNWNLTEPVYWKDGMEQHIKWHHEDVTNNTQNGGHSAEVSFQGEKRKEVGAHILKEP